MLIFSARVTDKAKVNICARNVGKDRWAAPTAELPCLLFFVLNGKRKRRVVAR